MAGSARDVHRQHLRQYLLEAANVNFVDGPRDLVRNSSLYSVEAGSTFKFDNDDNVVVGQLTADSPLLHQNPGRARRFKTMTMTNKRYKMFLKNVKTRIYYTMARIKKPLVVLKKAVGRIKKSVGRIKKPLVLPVF